MAHPFTPPIETPMMREIQCSAVCLHALAVSCNEVQVMDFTNCTASSIAQYMPTLQCVYVHGDTNVYCLRDARGLFINMYVSALLRRPVYGTVYIVSSTLYPLMYWRTCLQTHLGL